MTDPKLHGYHICPTCKRADLARAQRRIELAQRVLPPSASEQLVEDVAYSLMYLDEDMIASLEELLGHDQEA